MDFKKATDVLFAKIDHADLAKALGVSVPSIRQARLSPDAAAYRSPPTDWERAVAELAKMRVRQYQRLLDAVERRSS